MASHLASIYGTENDKVNCSFYYKIGACRHGEKCSRKHVKPTYSNTVLCSNLYQNPANGESDPLNEDGSKMTKADLDKHFALFYEDIYMEAAKLGRLEEMIVCENGNDHLTGNTYLRFRNQEDAQRACDLFNTRWYAGRPVWCELSPVNDFTESCCRQHDTNECSRGNMCNFMHAKRPPRQLAKDLDASQRKFYNRQRDRKSKRGKLGQIEYALAAVNQGVTSLGIKASNGIVLATEKKSASSLVNSDSHSKIELITPDIGMVYAGMGPDFRVLVDKARKVAQTSYKRVYNEYPPTRMLVQEIAKIVQEATQSGGVRPYGVSLLVAGHDEHNGFTLYQVDPSGSYFPWKATAIGKGSTSAKTFLEKRWNEELELEDAIHIALLTLKESIEGEMNGDTVEISIVSNPADHLLGFEGVAGAVGPRYRKLTPQEIEDRLDTL